MSYTITTKTQLVSITVELTGDLVAGLAQAAPFLRNILKSDPNDSMTAILQLLEDLERIHTANSSAPRPIKGRRPRSQAPIAG